MTVPEPKAVVPRNVYDFVERIREEQPALMTSVAGMVKLAREEKEREVARWIKLNPISYGVGYWNGFIPDDADEKSAPEEIVDDIIENSKKVQEHAENIKEELKEKPERKRRRIPPQEINNEYRRNDS
ncbi:hypothetical protein KA005_83885 [bacterium]|nr:hypothetical protein [bacterium]